MSPSSHSTDSGVGAALGKRVIAIDDQNIMTILDDDSSEESSFNEDEAPIVSSGESSSSENDEQIKYLVFIFYWIFPFLILFIIFFKISLTKQLVQVTEDDGVQPSSSTSSVCEDGTTLRDSSSTPRKRPLDSDSSKHKDRKKVRKNYCLCCPRIVRPSLFYRKNSEDGGENKKRKMKDENDD